MANLSGLNKLIKLQQILRPLNAHSSILACSTYASAVLLQNQRLHLQQKTQQQAKFQQKQFARTTTTKTPSIDEFRASEEKREQEFARTQETTDASSHKQEETEDTEKSAHIDSIRTKILEASLTHVPKLGWTRQALVQGAEDVGFPGTIHGIFPEGGYAIVSHFYGKCNDALVLSLQTETNNGKTEVTDPTAFLVRAVRERLEMIIPYKAQWPQAQALIALPPNAATSLAQLLTLVDDICYYSGDRSVNMGWYTRRIGLATIVKMTELFMLTDSSPQHAKTWEFLQNRMDEAVQLETLLGTNDVTQKMQRSFNSAFITARNILGLNYDRT